MRIGLISDTHGLLRPEVFGALEGVDHIVHAGDVGDSDILVELEAIAPLTAVWGNTDDWGIRALLPESARIELGGMTVAVAHGHRFDRPSAPLAAAAFPDADLVVFGHSHKPEIERIGRVLAVNPGSAGPARFNLPVTVAMAEIAEGLVSATLITLVRR